MEAQGAIGVVRLSGPDAAGIARTLFRPRGKSGRGAWRSHHLYVGRIANPEDGTMVDEVLLAYMRAPRSYTGQDVVELSCHGGIAVREVLRLALAAGARAAERGEMTLRAFLAGKLDLAQAEAVVDAVEARTPAALSVAVEQLGGALSSRVATIRAPLMSLYAHLEATIDFDEDDVPPVPGAEMRAVLGQALTDVGGLLETAGWGQLYRGGVKVALVGRPNVGKSSLLNALLGQDRAIVTDVPGTTRDVVEETIDLNGVPATVADTAGIVATNDVVERLGVERSRRAVAAADGVVLVLDGSAPLTVADREIAELIRPTAAVIAVNKDDLPQRMARSEAEHLLSGVPMVTVSAQTGTGIGDLRATLRRALTGFESARGEGMERAVVTNQRQREALGRAKAALAEAITAVEAGEVADAVCTDVRAALSALGEISGESVSEDVLSQIFSRFCIGK